MAWFGGGVAVVTGAASGIGRALAGRLAEERCPLALADIDEAGLAKTAAALAGKRVEVTTHVLDVSDEAGVRAFADDVVVRHGRATLLINNAGVALLGRFEEISLDDLRWLMGINFWGVVYGVKYFLPILKKQPRAHIANLSSIFGIVAPAGQSAYCASKFAVRGFTEVLRHELEGTSVGVSCVHPGGIRTAIVQRARLGAGAPPAMRDEVLARFGKLAKMPPEAAAVRIVRGIERGEPRILVGLDAVRMDFLQRLRPATYWKALARKIQEPQTVGAKA